MSFVWNDMLAGDNDFPKEHARCPFKFPKNMLIVDSITKVRRDFI